MVAVNCVIAVCFAVLTVEVAYMAFHLIFKKRAERIAFLRSFKKGKCIIIYFSAIPLFCLGHLYAGQDFFEAFFNAVNQIINLVVLKYSTASVQQLMADSVFFRVTVYYGFTLVGLNALFFTFSLAGQRIWQFFRSISFELSKREKLYIIGCNRNNLSIYRSDGERSKVILDKISDSDCYDLYVEKIFYQSPERFGHILKKIFMGAAKGRRYTVVINTENEEKNLELCREFLENIRETDEGARANLFKLLRIFVFGDPRYEAIYVDVASSGCGCIRYVNKYQMIAMDFIDKYPFTKFMDERHIDYETALLRDGVEINVCLIGFGKTNRQIFLTSVANNQFLCRGEEGPLPKKVKYFIFDKDPVENNKNLNHTYYRFRDECARLNQSDYLPFPALPADESYYHLDINDSKFYSHIRKIVTAHPKSVNLIVIAFGRDLENIDLAQKLAEKRREWEAEDVKLFVKARGLRKAETLLDEEDCYFIGNERDDVFKIDRIVNDKFFQMAQMRNEIYDLEYKITHDENFVPTEQAILENAREANRDWFVRKSRLERESSLYSCLSLRSKLNLIGLDYVLAGSGGSAVTEEEYEKLYSVGFPIESDEKGKRANGKRIVRFGLEALPSKRTNLAILEHQRWNAFMICKGMVPSSKEQIMHEKVLKEGKEKFDNGKNYRLRRHGNITSFEGLILFRKMLAARDSVDELETDVIKYDYQLMDDAYWLLSGCGYQIIERKKEK